jgi:hypothetical protein
MFLSYNDEAVRLNIVLLLISMTMLTFFLIYS